MNQRRFAVVAAGLMLLLISFTALSFPSAQRGSMLGKRLPPLNVGEWIQGNPQDVGAWGDGKVYVLDLWGTWCKPCIANIPKLTKIQAAYRDRGLVVIGYSWEKPKIVRDFVKKMGEQMRYVVVSDPSEVTLGRLTEMEAVKSFPYAFLIDKTGKVVWAGHPEDDDLSGAVERLFARQ